MQVLTMDSKEKRDDLFRQYRESTEENERRVVKFSDVRPVMADGKQSLDDNGKPVYVSTYSIAYPDPEPY